MAPLDLHFLDYYAWGVVEWETNKHPHNTIDFLKATITSVMSHMDEAHLIRACKRFWQIIESVIAAEGDFIEQLYNRRVTYFALKSSLQ